MGRRRKHGTEDLSVARNGLLPAYDAIIVLVPALWQFPSTAPWNLLFLHKLAVAGIVYCAVLYSAIPLDLGPKLRGTGDYGAPRIFHANATIEKKIGRDWAIIAVSGCQQGA